jgi:Eco57I restriction-modification methylase
MSTNGLNSESKKAVKSNVLFLRELLEGEFDSDTGEAILPGGDITRQIARFGISLNQPASLDNDRTPDYLTNDEKEKRIHICAAIKREVSLFGKTSDIKAYKRGMRAFIRQTSYTWINRLLGLKCMEVRGLLKDEHGEPDFVVTVSEDYGGLPRRAWRIKGLNPEKWQTAKLYDLQCETILSACRQLTQEIKVLFDPDHAFGLIWPSAPALNTIIDKIQELNSIGNPSPFQAHDFLGWVYQYFQSKEKDQVFEAASKKKRKIEKDDIIPATQIYTEHYMVEYLVQNTLGRFWMEMHYDSKLSKNWEYYVKPTEENSPVERELKKAIDLKLMDPAVGSGHFHLVAFDLLMSMYKEETENAGQPGWPETPSVKDENNIPYAILANNLYGIDIDARSIQLAALVLVMKAREAGYDGPINRLNLVVANNAPFESEAWYKYIQDLKSQKKHSVARVLSALGLQLKNLDEFGSLLRIEDEMHKIIKDEKKQWIAQAKTSKGQIGIFPELEKPKQQRIPFEKAITDETFFDRLGSVIEEELDNFYLKSRKEGLAEEAIMAADACRGFDFLRFSMRRYDVVVANPPYMGSKNMGATLKSYLTQKYPSTKRDLYAAFLNRSFEFLLDYGYAGLVTLEGWCFIKAFNAFRKSVLKKYTLESVVYLGRHAFSDADPPGLPTMSTLSRRLPQEAHLISSIRIIGSLEAAEQANIIRSRIKNLIHLYRTKQASLLLIPNTGYYLWLPQEVLDTLSNCRRTSDISECLAGLQTGDVPRFVRYFWELNGSNDRWIPYAQGGATTKWYGLEWGILDWYHSGNLIQKHSSSRWQGVHRFGDVGLSYSESARGKLAFRLISGSGFSQSGSAVFPNSDISVYGLAAALSSRFASYCARFLRPGRVFPVGYLSLIPVPENIDLVAELAESAVIIKRKLCSSDPIERNFEFFKSMKSNNLKEHLQNIHTNEFLITALLHTIEGIIENQIFSLFGFHKSTIKEILDETGVPASWSHLIKSYDLFPQVPLHLPKFSKKIKRLIEQTEKRLFSSDELETIRGQLQLLYKAGPGAVEKNNNENIEVRVPIPPETFLEELSQKLKIHPISIYWLLKDMWEKEGLTLPSELKRYAEDYVSVVILRMLGFQWPKQWDSKEPIPDWADNDGIIPLTEGSGESALLERIRKRFSVDFGEEKEASIESEFANIVGKPLEKWLEQDFFVRHVKQFKNRPIAWQINSDPFSVDQSSGASGKGKKKRSGKKLKPAFSVLVHYHQFADGEKGYGKILLLKNKYLEKLMSQARYELESLRGKGDDPETFDRIAELDRKLLELEDFRDRLERIQEGKDREARIHVRWKDVEDQPRGWRPDINDGVKINIAPWERLGMFPIKKIVGKVEMESD